MIREFAQQNGRLVPVEPGSRPIGELVWIDLLSPSLDEERALEARLGVELPTREEMEEIEISSRLYSEEGASYMTATLPVQAEADSPQAAPVTFVLSGGRLITIRYHEPRAFENFRARAEKVAMGCETGEGVLIALLEAVVDRLADVLELAGRDIEGISRTVFQPKSDKPTSAKNFHALLGSIGRKGDLNSKIRDSLVTMERLVGYLGPEVAQRGVDAGLRERVRTLGGDVRSLSDHANFLAQKITFLLDATLGLINIEQNAIIKIFSVAAVVFLPPTLIASIYGMNFTHMPELDWPFGYPMALGLMVASAILPYLFFKHRGWL